MSTALASANISAFLFDLDGTLVDTAPDLIAALNSVLQLNQLSPIPYATLRPLVSNGADALISYGFGENLPKKKHQAVKASFLNYYQEHLAQESRLFDGFDQVLLQLEKQDIPWGIVTNKPEYLTTPLLNNLQLLKRASCVVCGDQVTQPKPHPESILMACRQLSIAPNTALYLGDAKRDIQAAKLAGLKSIACSYGYIPPDDDITRWQADRIIKHPDELLVAAQMLFSASPALV